MKRKESRENAFLAVFELSFGHSTPKELLAAAAAGESIYPLDDFGVHLLRLYVAHAAQVDALIEGKLRGWSSERITRTSQGLLRLAVAEMFYGGQQDMDSIIINEAVELARRYGTDKEYGFVNGVLGALSRERAAAGDGSAALQVAPAGADEPSESGAPASIADEPSENDDPNSNGDAPVGAKSVPAADAAAAGAATQA